MIPEVIKSKLPANLLTTIDIIQTPIGELKTLNVFCDSNVADTIIDFFASLGIVHEKFSQGVKLHI